MIDAYASRQHYADHLFPIWRQLTKLGVAGTFYAQRLSSWGKRPHRRDVDRLVLVASHADAIKMSPSRVVYVEHGAGQTYDGDPHSAFAAGYSGAPGLDRAVLFVCPSEQVVERWRLNYPRTPAVAVGCPKLDRWHRSEISWARLRGLLWRRPITNPVVALSFHWDCPLVPETRSAWPHYLRGLRDVLDQLALDHVKVLGHAHPRAWQHLSSRWNVLGVEPVQSLDEVFGRAHCFVADNTSALFEFASLDRPVVVLDAPWYRRHVEHGGRFWQWADVGVRVSNIAELQPGIVRALSEPDEVVERRRAIVPQVYAACDGSATERAVAAIVEVAGA